MGVIFCVHNDFFRIAAKIQFWRHSAVSPKLLAAKTKSVTPIFCKKGHFAAQE
jgi:hypothetical protein